ncbi:hypothetical protein ACYULU_07490 [Breznakiellaceae bacterium SP9]
MMTVQSGKTSITVHKNGFGALPMQRRTINASLTSRFFVELLPRKIFIADYTISIVFRKVSAMD